MFRPPSSDFADLEVFADWVEACALYSEEELIAKAEAADVLRDEGLLGTSSGDLFQQDLTYNDELSFSDEDSTGIFLDEVWQVLNARALLLSDLYPFSADAHQLRKRSGPWRNSLSYSVLLLADLWREYNLDETLAEEHFPRLFEKLVEASEKGLLRGSAVRFGVPRERGWPTPINDRIRYLGELMSLEVEALDGKTSPSDGDRGLDVAGRLSFGDDGPGTIILLTQCATGKHWTTKTGEPSYQNWGNILRWNALLLRAVAVPWRLSESERLREFRRFDAVIMDRFRLLSGNPDKHLEPGIKRQLFKWCEDRLSEIPSVG